MGGEGFEIFDASSAERIHEIGSAGGTLGNGNSGVNLIKMSVYEAPQGQAQEFQVF
jgi:hypothetical protein